MKINSKIMLGLLVLIMLLLVACTNNGGSENKDENIATEATETTETEEPAVEMILATTTSTQDSGLPAGKTDQRVNFIISIESHIKINLVENVLTQLD
jgi:hypothetical protein